MKMFAILAATGLLAAGAAIAATPAATPAAAPAATTAPAPAAAPMKHDNHCRDEANEKKLAGAARAAFIKKCRADSKPAK